MFHRRPDARRARLAHLVQHLRQRGIRVAGRPGAQSASDQPGRGRDLGATSTSRVLRHAMALRSCSDRAAGDARLYGSHYVPVAECLCRVGSPAGPCRDGQPTLPPARLRARPRRWRTIAGPMLIVAPAIASAASWHWFLRQADASGQRKLPSRQASPQGRAHFSARSPCVHPRPAFFRGKF